MKSQTIYLFFAFVFLGFTFIFVSPNVNEIKTRKEFMKNFANEYAKLEKEKRDTKEKEYKNEEDVEEDTEEAMNAKLLLPENMYREQKINLQDYFDNFANQRKNVPGIVFTVNTIDIREPEKENDANYKVSKINLSVILNRIGFQEFLKSIEKSGSGEEDSIDQILSLANIKQIPVRKGIDKKNMEMGFTINAYFAINEEKK